MTTTLAVERIGGLLENPGQRACLFAMHDEHWQEVAKFKELLKLNPDYSRYEQLDREKRALLVVMREDGRIVGYSLHIILRSHPHYRHVMVAEDDIHYLSPHLRKTGEHTRMRRFALERLKAQGVHIVTARTKFGHEHDHALRALGFEPMDSMYACDLTKWTPPAEA
jgi:L-amino acid N-acyltransferase YncA